MRTSWVGFPEGVRGCVSIATTDVHLRGLLPAVAITAPHNIKAFIDVHHRHYEDINPQCFHHMCCLGSIGGDNDPPKKGWW